jgi:uncharacterized protein DUF2511
MAQRAWVIVLLVFVGGCNSRAQNITDPIPDIPVNQQRTATRSEFRWQWPFTVGAGTLGCASGAVVFRTGGVGYALNDAAAAKGFASATPLQVTVSSAPQNPLARVRQDTRMQIFAQAVACNSGARESLAAASDCRRRLRDTHGLSDDELKQIEAEGAERRWHPLLPEYKTLAPLVEAGLKLCPK